MVIEKRSVVVAAAEEVDGRRARVIEVQRRAQRASFVEMKGGSFCLTVGLEAAACLSRAREESEKKKMEEVTQELVGK